MNLYNNHLIIKNELIKEYLLLEHVLDNKLSGIARSLKVEKKSVL